MSTHIGDISLRSSVCPHHVLCKVPHSSFEVYFSEHTTQNYSPYSDEKSSNLKLFRQLVAAIFPLLTVLYSLLLTVCRCLEFPSSSSFYVLYKRLSSSMALFSRISVKITQFLRHLPTASR